MVNLGAVDMGNSQFKATLSINGSTSEYRMPNAIARCLKTDDEIDYFDRGAQKLFDNMIVEVNSPALKVQNDRYYVGLSATTQEEMSDVKRNHQKATSDRAAIELLSLLAYHAVSNNWGKEEVKVDFKVLAVCLPMLQVKGGRGKLQERLKGIHRVKFIKVPIDDKEIINITVTINIEDVVVGIEGSIAHIGLTRDSGTLKVNQPDLMKDSLLIVDAGGDSLDMAFLQNARLQETEGSQVFGINEYLDKIRSDIQKKFNGYTFPSRNHLERLIAENSPTKWNIKVNQKDVSIKSEVDKHLTGYAIKFLDLLEKATKQPSLQDVVDIFCVGGAAKVSKHYIEQENIKREEGQQFILTFPDNMDMLNLKGLWILVQMYAQKYHNTVVSEVAATKENVTEGDKNTTNKKS